MGETRRSDIKTQIRRHGLSITQKGEYSMKSFSVSLCSIADVKYFVNAACQQPFDIDIVSGRYIIDAKSIMGIFSLDLAKPIRVEVHGTEQDISGFYDAVERFVVEEEE